MVEKLDQRVGQLVPELAFPTVFEGDEKMLQICRRGISLVRQEIGDISIHDEALFHSDSESVVLCAIKLKLEVRT